MASPKTVYTCNECGASSPRWLGKCPGCGAWNSLLESAAEATGGGGKNRLGSAFSALAPAAPVQPLAAIEAVDVARTPTGQSELDRVLGGGIVAGGVVLIGGDPGIGKSTLLLQALDSLQRAQLPTLYITGEESGAQVALRARRLGITGSQVAVLAEIQLEKILATLAAQQPAVAVIDSIQTVYSDQLTSAPGSVAQVRECAAHLTRWAKASGCAVVLVGHVTKDGQLAGPRVLEHMVDTVLYFEGERHHAHRRASTGEPAVGLGHRSRRLGRGAPPRPAGATRRRRLRRRARRPRRAGGGGARRARGAAVRQPGLRTRLDP